MTNSAKAALGEEVRCKDAKQSLRCNEKNRLRESESKERPPCGQRTAMCTAGRFLIEDFPLYGAVCTTYYVDSHTCVQACENFWPSSSAIDITSVALFAGI